MNIKEIVEATQGILLSGDDSFEITGYTQDSRLVKEGMMYIPIVGERLDGHTFIKNAFDNGASAVITAQDISYPDKIVIKVEDTLKALGDMARYLRTHRDVKVVGITGSVGKTSTKDMIYSVVSQKYKALKTLGNYNNHIGLPLTILRYVDEEVMVIEMGMNHLGEIDYLSKIAQPDISAITNVGTAHIGEVGSRENILKAKMEIVHGMNDGILVINKDNDMLSRVKEDGFTLKTIAIDSDADLKAEDMCLYDDHSTFKIHDTLIHVPVPGKHFIYNALVAIEIGLNLGMSIEECQRGIETFELTKGRADVLNIGNMVIYDGTYNANLDSMKASIDVLSEHQGRKIAILGDMLELGDYSKSIHHELGQYLTDKHIDIVLCIGQAMKDMKESMKDIDMRYFENNKDICLELDTLLKDNDAILVKGSNSMHLNEIINYLKGKYA